MAKNLYVAAFICWEEYRDQIEFCACVPMSCSNQNCCIRWYNICVSYIKVVQKDQSRDTIYNVIMRFLIFQFSGLMTFLHRVHHFIFSMSLHYLTIYVKNLIEKRYKSSYVVTPQPRGLSFYATLSFCLLEVLLLKLCEKYFWNTQT